MNIYVYALRKEEVIVIELQISSYKRKRKTFGVINVKHCMAKNQ